MKTNKPRLTEQTKLLIDHWPAVQDIIAAERELQPQLTAFLHSLKDDLAQLDWWSDQWHFEPQDDQQAYIAHARWRVKKSGYALWLGVERFHPPVLFAKETFPQLYLWSSEKNPGLIASLRNSFQTKKMRVLGAVETKSGLYIIRHFLPKTLPGQAKAFEQTMRSRILQFFSCYAQQEKAISAHVARHVKR